MGVSHSKLVAQHLLNACENSQGENVDPALLGHGQFQECLKYLMRDMNRGNASLQGNARSVVCSYVSFKKYPDLYVQPSSEIESWIDRPERILDFLPAGSHLPDRVFQAAVRSGHGVRRVCTVVFARLASQLSKCYDGCAPHALVPHLYGTTRDVTADIDFLSETAPYLEMLYRAHPGLLLVTAYGMQGKTPEGEDDDDFELILPADRHRLDDVLEQLNQQEAGDVYKRAAEAVVDYLNAECDVWLQARMATVTRVIVDERVKAEKAKRAHRFWYWRSQQLKEQQLTGDDSTIPNIDDVSIDFFLRIVTAKSKFRRKAVKPPTRACRKKQTIEFPAGFLLVDGEAVPQGAKKATTTSGGTQTSPSPRSHNSGRPEIASGRSTASSPRSPLWSPAPSQYRVSKSTSAATPRSASATPRSIIEISDDDSDDGSESQLLIQPTTEWSTQLASPFLTLPTLPLTTPSPVPPAFRSWEPEEDDCLADRLIQSSTQFRGHSKTPELTLPSAKEVEEARKATAPTARVVSAVLSTTETGGAAEPSLFVESPYVSMASPGLFVESPASSSQSSAPSSPRFFGESPAPSARSSARPLTGSAASSPGPFAEYLTPSAAALAGFFAEPQTSSLSASSSTASTPSSPGRFVESRAQTPTQTQVPAQTLTKTPVQTPTQAPTQTPAQAPAPAPARTWTNPFQSPVQFPTQNSAQSSCPPKSPPSASSQVVQFSTEFSTGTAQFLNFPSKPAPAKAASQDLAQVDGSMPLWDSTPANAAPQDLAQVDHSMLRWNSTPANAAPQDLTQVDGSMPQWNSAPANISPQDLTQADNPMPQWNPAASMGSYAMESMPAMAESYTANPLRQDCALTPSMPPSEFMPVSFPADPMISAMEMTDYESQNVSGIDDAALQYNMQMASFPSSTPVANFGTPSNMNTGIFPDQNSFLSPFQTY